MDRNKQYREMLEAMRKTREEVAQRIRSIRDLTDRLENKLHDIDDDIFAIEHQLLNDNPAGLRLANNEGEQV